MAEPCLADLRSLVAQACARHEKLADIECRHFFAGAAAYVAGRIFMTLTPVGLALKLPQDARDALFARGATPLRYFPAAPVKKDYALLPPQLVDNTDILADYIARAIEFARR